jgi:hypothetical protein
MGLERAADLLTMRSALHRLLLACGLAAIAAACVPSSSAAAAPQGSLTVAEYDALLLSFQRGEALDEDRTPTVEETAGLCTPLTPSPTALLASIHASCLASVRYAEVLFGPDATKGCKSKDMRCMTRDLLRMERATRGIARTMRVVRSAVAERGLTGQCARAINGPPGNIELYEAFANAVRDLRRALIAESERALRRATTRLERLTERGADIVDNDSVALLATCPRV